MPPTPHVPFSQDAALVVALAGTAIPFAHSAEDEAERWLRVFRLHGQVGSALQGLGVGEAPLMTQAELSDNPAGTPRHGPESVDDAAKRAMYFAETRHAERTGTADILFAVLEAYDKLFDRALYLRGTSRDELVQRLSGSRTPVDNGATP